MSGPHVLDFALVELGLHLRAQAPAVDDDGGGDDADVVMMMAVVMMMTFFVATGFGLIFVHSR